MHTLVQNKPFKYSLVKYLQSSKQKIQLWDDRASNKHFIENDNDLKICSQRILS